MNNNNVDWTPLQDAYGAATEVSRLLDYVSAHKEPPHDLQSGPWFDLWSRLCHQGTIYSASYPAVLVLVSALRDVQPPVAMDFFLLPASIEIARFAGRGPELPKNLSAEYFAALNELAHISRKFEATQDPSLKRSIQAAQLVAERKHAEAEALLVQD